MNNLEKGKFFGSSKNQFHVNGLTIVHSDYHGYTHCPWHYHENAHFAFTTAGSLIETHQKKQIHLSAGSLMYNHSEEPHCNSGYSPQVSALHIELDTYWLKKYDINFSVVKGARVIQNPIIKSILLTLLTEVKNLDDVSPLAIETMMLQAMNEMITAHCLQTPGKPAWVLKVKDLLYDKYDENLSLEQIASEINIHPVYLCQQFSHYFRCSPGEYRRKIRVEKAVEYIFNYPFSSLTEIAYACGFADQSHFIRIFKMNTGITPLAFRKLTSRRAS